jgi:hypothetical protein
MPTDRTTSAGPIRLNYRSVQQVVVEKADEDRFLMTAREAARACEQAQDVKELLEQFKAFLVYLRDWCEKHAADLCAAYAYPGDGFLNVLLCTKGEGYRFDLDDAVTELDIDIARQFSWLAAEVLQAPERAREGHPSIEKAIIVYGDGSSTHLAGQP